LKQFYLLFLFATGFAFGQTNTTTCQTLFKINKKLQNEHFKPKPLDDSLSVFVFSKFLNELDEDHELFLKSEIEDLNKYTYSIDDAIKNGDCKFISDFYQVYQAATVRLAKIISEIKTEIIPKSSSEKVSFSKNPSEYKANEAELKKFYKKKILFQTLRNIVELSESKDSLKQNFDSLFETSKNKTLDSFICKVANLNLSQQQFQSLLYNTFCSYFDPHTVYLSQEDKSSFLSFVSADNFTFGLYVNVSDKNEIFVTQIIPGSSAYFSEKVIVGDQILKIKVQSTEYEVSCSSIQKIQEIMTSDSYKTAEVTLRKKSGELVTVSLDKKIMKDYENKVSSYLIKKDGMQFGYIKIPSFYAVFENGNTSVSADVTKEIFKLRKDNIEGLIIDLQDNGGGSLEEAVKLSGMFIDVGPVAIMNKPNEKDEIIKDAIRGTVYKDNLVILMNGFSASASEFFANAMQDYNRALILGTSSYGKATMQQILPIEEKGKPEEFLKITLQKFYRITGESNQYIGVQPDVKIPILFDEQMPREKDEEMALTNSKIETNARFLPLNTFNKTAIVQQSKNRLAQNKNAIRITELNEQINAAFDGQLPEITLNLDAVFEQVNTVNVLWKSVGEFTKNQYDIEVSPNSTDTEYDQFNEFLKSNTIEKIKLIKSNLAIFEATNCLIDLKK
jgi:carboxyl-terminal processing protease